MLLHTTEAWAEAGRVYTTYSNPVRHLYVSTPQGHELQLDVSTLQNPVLHLYVSTPQGPKLHLDLSGQQEPLLLLWVYIKRTLAAPGRVYTA